MAKNKKKGEKKPEETRDGARGELVGVVAPASEKNPLLLYRENKKFLMNYIGSPLQSILKNRFASA